jgi:tetratricopeptide (TPR) repeat protein
LRVIEGTGDLARSARVYNWLGRTSYALGRQQEATRCFQELVRLTAGTADDLARALPYQVLGRVYIFQGRFEEAAGAMLAGFSRAGV